MAASGWRLRYAGVSSRHCGHGQHGREDVMGQEREPQARGLESAAPAPRILHVVTADISVGLMRGQPQFLRDMGFEVVVAALPGSGLDAAVCEGAQAIPVLMERESAPLRDLVCLRCLWWRGAARGLGGAMSVRGSEVAVRGWRLQGAASSDQRGFRDTQHGAAGRPVEPGEEGETIATPFRSRELVSVRC
jgi:hypothetical protein